MPQNFIVLSTQRTGSTWVIDMLNSHPNILAFSEMFLPNGHGKRFGGAQDKVFFDEYKANYPDNQPTGRLLENYLDYLLAPRKNIQATGFKLMYSQLGAFPELGALLASRNVAVVHLLRNNILDMLISRETAVKRDIFHIRSARPVKPVQVRINTENLLAQLSQELEQRKMARQHMETLGLSYLEVRYEDMVATHENFRIILNFLCVNDVRFDLKSPLQKVNAGNRDLLIENYEEVRSALVRTRYESFLN